jgi:hypothetical protein
MVLRCFQNGFLGHVHKYLGFLVTDPVDMHITDKQAAFSSKEVWALVERIWLSDETH